MTRSGGDAEGVSQLARPEDAIDTYGRLVGWAVLPDRARVKTWLLETGLGAPALYSGFTEDDRARLVAAAQVGRRALAARWTTPAGAFPWSVVGSEAPPPERDAGRFVHPKLFRRWATWAVRRRAGVVRASFAAWLAAGEDQFAEVQVDGAGPLRYSHSRAVLVVAGPGQFLEAVFRAARARVRTDA